MTNREKYQEVFGIYPDTTNCPASICMNCPCSSNKENDVCEVTNCRTWWESEYKEPEIQFGNF